jgi:hypothetical protein
MATLILRLEIDPVTQKKNVWVKYESDSDALPLEHEDAHKRLVAALLAGGQVKPGELGEVVIEREGQAPVKVSEPAVAPTAPEGVKQGR